MHGMSHSMSALSLTIAPSSARSTYDDSSSVLMPVLLSTHSPPAQYHSGAPILPPAYASFGPLTTAAQSAPRALSLSASPSPSPFSPFPIHSQTHSANGTYSTSALAVSYTGLPAAPLHLSPPPPPPLPPTQSQTITAPSTVSSPMFKSELTAARTTPQQNSVTPLYRPIQHNNAAAVTAPTLPLSLPIAASTTSLSSSSSQAAAAAASNTPARPRTRRAERRADHTVKRRFYNSCHICKCGASPLIAHVRCKCGVMFCSRPRCARRLNVDFNLYSASLLSGAPCVHCRSLSPVQNGDESASAPQQCPNSNCRAKRRKGSESRKYSVGVVTSAQEVILAQRPPVVQSAPPSVLYNGQFSNMIQHSNLANMPPQMYSHSHIIAFANQQTHAHLTTHNNNGGHALHHHHAAAAAMGNTSSQHAHPHQHLAMPMALMPYSSSAQYYHLQSPHSMPLPLAQSHPQQAPMYTQQSAHTQHSHAHSHHSLSLLPMTQPHSLRHANASSPPAATASSPPMPHGGGMDGVSINGDNGLILINAP